MTGSSRHRRVLLAVSTGALACIVALLVGCSSSAKTTTGSTAAGSLTSSSSSPAAPPSASPASSAQLATIVLQPSDLPAGWKGTPYQADPKEAAQDAALARCLGLSLTSDRVAEVHSDDFALGDAGVSSSAGSYRSQSAVDSHLAVLRSSKAAPCLEQELKQQLAITLPAEATIESMSFKLTPGSTGGPANVVGTGAATLKIRVRGQQAVAYVGVAFITGPLIQAQVDAENVGTPVPASLMESLVAKVANRAARA